MKASRMIQVRSKRMRARNFCHTTTYILYQKIRKRKVHFGINNRKLLFYRAIRNISGSECFVLLIPNKNRYFLFYITVKNKIEDIYTWMRNHGWKRIKYSLYQYRKNIIWDKVKYLFQFWLLYWNEIFHFYVYLIDQQKHFKY